MHDLAFTEEAEMIGYIGIVGKTDEIVVSHARFLLRRPRLGKIGEVIALDSYVFHIKMRARYRQLAIMAAQCPIMII